MADEKFENEQNELAGTETEQLDERVETAIRNVAEEAREADNALEDELTEKKRRERRSKQARAAKEAEAPRVVEQPAKAGGLAGLGVGAWIGISVACLALGLVLGRFVLGGVGSAGTSNFTGSTTVTEAQLDDTFATYTYDGADYTITVREVMEQLGTVDSMKDEEGNYTLPTAEYAISVARSKILAKEVEAHGITVTDEEIAKYAEENLGTSDFDAVASAYGMDADSVKSLIAENCSLNALREEVIGGELPTQPDAPEAAEEGKEDEVTKEYADYIIKLAGSEWSKKKGEWKDKDGRFATALADSDFSADGASYTAAETAYYVAYQIYSEQQSEMTDAWTEYSNGLMSKASLKVNTLVQ